MTFSLGYSPWLLALALLVAGGLSYWAYRRTVPSLAPAWRGLLGGLRFLSLALLLFLLLEPVVRHLNESTQPPLLAVLVDDSQSLRVVTGSGDSASAESARAAVAPILSSLNAEASGGTSRWFRFDRTMRSVPSSGLDSLAFSGDRTNISAALERLPAEVQSSNLKGVVLISDGQYNAGQTPLRLADRYPVPIHTVTVGDTTQQRDLLVSRVVTNDVGYTESEVPVRATIRAEQIDAGPVRAQLRSGDSLITETEVRLPGGTAEVPVEFSFRPQRPGLTQLSVRVSSVAGEATTRNNSRSTSLRVLDRRRQVLLLGAAPSPSYAAIRRTLDRDGDTQLTTRVPRRDGSFYGGPLPDTLSRYDVIVLAGFPSAPVSTQATQRVADALSADGPAGLFILDRQTNVAAWREHFGAILPAEPPSSPLQFRERAVALSEQARSHPIFETEAPLDRVGDLPPLQVPTAAWMPSPDARVLATSRASTASEGAPLLVVRSRAGQRSALFLGTDTWRWATLPPSLAFADPFWPDLFSNLLRWTATQSPDQQVRIRPLALQFDGDEPVELTGQVYDENMSPLESATVDVTITDSTGRNYSYVMDSEGSGRYALNVGSLPEGTYDYQATARASNAVVGRDQGQFSVGALQVEYQSPKADPVLMRQIAARSGGRAYTPTTLSSFSSDLAQSTTFSAEIVTNPTENELWRRWPFLAVLLGLLAAEWALRKRLGLT